MWKRRIRGSVTEGKVGEQRRAVAGSACTRCEFSGKAISREVCGRAGARRLRKPRPWLHYYAMSWINNKCHRRRCNAGRVLKYLRYLLPMYRFPLRPVLPRRAEAKYPPRFVAVCTLEILFIGRILMERRARRSPPDRTSLRALVEEDVKAVFKANKHVSPRGTPRCLARRSLPSATFIFNFSSPLAARVSLTIKPSFYIRTRVSSKWKQVNLRGRSFRYHRAGKNREDRRR